MKNKTKFTAKLLILVLIATTLTLSAAADNVTYVFDSAVSDSDQFEDTELNNFNALVLTFESGSFDNPKSIYNKKSTDSGNISIDFVISETEDKHYATYFYDGNGKYLTWESTLNLSANDNESGKTFNTDIYFGKKKDAISKVSVEQFDELAAGEAVDVGVNISAESPLDSTSYTGYVPDGGGGTINNSNEPDLTGYYETDVRYNLNVKNLTANNTLLPSKRKTGTATIDFGETERLNFGSVVDETGSYNITAETDPSVDPKIHTDTAKNSTDYSEVDYLSEIETYVSNNPPEFSVTSASPSLELKGFSDQVDEESIAESIEYVWLDNLESPNLVDKVKQGGGNGLDEVDVSNRTNYTDREGGSLDTPLNLNQNTQGDWYLCHRAWADDTRSTITKGKTTCDHFMYDNTSPVFNSVTGPTGNKTYKEDGFTFNATVSDNVQLNNVELEVGNHKKSFNITNTTGPNDYSYKYKLDASDRPYAYSWSASDRVGNSDSTSSKSIEVDPLNTTADIKVLNSSNQEATEFGLMEDVTLEVTTGTNEAPIKIDSNTSLASWSNITNEEGSYTQSLTLREEGIFKFNVTAGEGDSNYRDSTSQVIINVTSENAGEYSLDWNPTLQDQQIVEGEEFNYSLNTSYNGTASDLSWNVRNNNFTINSNGTKADLTNSTNLNKGEYEVPVEVYDSEGSYITDTFNLTINPRLHWSTEPSDQTITEGDRFSIDLSNNVNYVGDKSNLTWSTTSNKNLFTASDGIVEDTEELGTGTYTIGVKVSDNQGREAETSFDLTVNEETNTGGGGGGGSSSGGGGSLGSLSTQTETETESIDDRIQTSESEDYNFNITSTETGQRNIAVNLSEPTEINTSITGNLSQIAAIERFFNGTKGINQIPFNITSNETGVFEGNITLEWNNQSKNIPVTLTREELKTDYSVLILTNNDEIYSDRINYDVKVRDRANPDSRQSIQVSTRLLDENGTEVYRNSENTEITDVVIRNFETGVLEPGSYSIEATVTDSGKTFTGYKTVELRETEGITGRFTQATSGLQGAIDYIVNQINSLF